MVSLPEASLFEAQSVSDVWLEVVERTSKFLRSVVLGGELYSGSGGSAASAQPGNPIPMADRHTALSLLLEFAIQKGNSTLQQLYIKIKILEYLSLYMYHLNTFKFEWRFLWYVYFVEMWHVT